MVTRKFVVSVIATVRMPSVMKLWAALILVAGCATGGSETSDAPQSGPDDAPTTHHDAAHVTSDAPPHSDARPIDAFVPKDAPPDAPNTDDGLCPDSVNSECPMAGTCCFTVVCVPGTAIGDDLCIPN